MDRVEKIILQENVTCAAVCVYPQRVAEVKTHLKEIGKNIGIAAGLYKFDFSLLVTVAAGFPSGQYHLKSKVLEVELTVADGATEIDIVISRALALEDQWKSK